MTVILWLAGDRGRLHGPRTVRDGAAAERASAVCEVSGQVIGTSYIGESRER